MISEEWTAKLIDSSYYILEGDFGFYATTADRVDSGLADPRRYALASTRAALLKKLLPENVKVILVSADADEKIELKLNNA